MVTGRLPTMPPLLPTLGVRIRTLLLARCAEQWRRSVRNDLFTTFGALGRCLLSYTEPRVLKVNYVKESLHVLYKIKGTKGTVITVHVYIEVFPPSVIM